MAASLLFLAPTYCDLGFRNRIRGTVSHRSAMVFPVLAVLVGTAQWLCCASTLLW